MKQILTKCIVLSRTDYGEADKILTVITPDHGKLRLMAKGVRKSTSKLAGGIELFSVSHISFIAGKRDIGTLVSTRLEQHFSEIVKDINRTMLGYELIKSFNKLTEDAAEREYFNLLHKALVALNDKAINQELIELWFNAQLLRLGGNTPNLKTDSENQPLKQDASYGFDVESMNFIQKNGGRYRSGEIKLMRLLFGVDDVTVLNNVKGIEKSLPTSRQLLASMLSAHLRYN